MATRRSARQRSCSWAVLAVSCCATGGGPFFGTTTSLVESFHPPTTHAASRFDYCRRAIAQSRRVRCYSSSSDDRSSSTVAAAVNNLPRIYIDSSSSSSTTLAAHAIVPLNANQANYLNVMRIHKPKRWGALAGHLRIFNGYDGEWLAQIVVGAGDDGGSGGGSGGKRNNPRRRDAQSSTVVACLEQLRAQPESPSSPLFSGIHLHIGRLKKPRRKWILEKATELGVDSINVVDTEFSSVMDAWEYDKHWLQVVEAAEQCERLTLPSLVEAPSTWDSLLDRMNDDDHPIGDTEENKHPSGGDEQWLICRERSPESLPLWQALSASASQDPSSSKSTTSTAYHVVVGPEGGWSPTELESFQEIQHRRPDRVQFVSLGSLVLRAETAAIAAVSAVALLQDTATFPTSR
jgi:RsmE family RNA methyltransferase